MDVRILVLYDSTGQQVQALAEAVSEGVSRIQGAQAMVMDIDQAGPEDLLDCDGVILGSPNWNGITGRLKSWLDQMSDLGQEGLLEGKIGAAFTAGRGRSAGTEFTLLAAAPLAALLGLHCRGPSVDGPHGHLRLLSTARRCTAA